MGGLFMCLWLVSLLPYVYLWQLLWACLTFHGISPPHRPPHSMTHCDSKSSEHYVTPTDAFTHKHLDCWRQTTIWAQTADCHHSPCQLSINHNSLTNYPVYLTRLANIRISGCHKQITIQAYCKYYHIKQKYMWDGANVWTRNRWQNLYSCPNCLFTKYF